MQQVASSTHSHAAHARTHGPRHAKPQQGCDFAAMLDEMASAKTDSPPQDATAQAGLEPKPETVGTSGNLPEPAQSTAQVCPAPTLPAPSVDEAANTPAAAPTLVLGEPTADAQAPAITKPAKPDTPKPVAADESPDAQPPSVTAGAAGEAIVAVPASAIPTKIAPQASPIAGQPPQAVEPQTIASGVTLVAPVAKQGAPQAKAKLEPGQPPRAADDEPQACAGGPIQPSPAAAIATAPNPTAAPKNHATEIAPNRAGIQSDKAGAGPIDDLSSAGTGPNAAAPPAGLAAQPAAQPAGTTPAVFNTPPAQAQLAPVPIAGVPVLIASKALGGDNHFDIRLDPPELGRIEVRLKVDREGQVSSHLIADRADTLALLRRDQTGLERALQDAGLKTGGDGLQFSLRDQGGNNQPDSHSAAPALLAQDNSTPPADLPRGYARYIARIGGVDIHV